MLKINNINAKNISTFGSRLERRFWTPYPRGRHSPERHHLFLRRRCTLCSPSFFLWLSTWKFYGHLGRDRRRKDNAHSPHSGASPSTRRIHRIVWQRTFHSCSTFYTMQPCVCAARQHASQRHHSRESPFRRSSSYGRKDVGSTSHMLCGICGEPTTRARLALGGTWSRT